MLESLEHGDFLPYLTIPTTPGYLPLSLCISCSLSLGGGRGGGTFSHCLFKFHLGFKVLLKYLPSSWRNPSLPTTCSSSNPFLHTYCLLLCVVIADAHVLPPLLDCQFLRNRTGYFSSLYALPWHSAENGTNESLSASLTLHLPSRQDWDHLLLKFRTLWGLSIMHSSPL